PGGNVTGLSLQSNDIAGKRLGLLREVVPGLSRLAILANISNPFSMLELGETRASARMLGFCKKTSSSWRMCGLASMYPACDWSLLRSGPSWISARVRSRYRTGLNGPFGSPVFASAGKTDPPSRFYPLADLGR